MSEFDLPYIPHLSVDQIAALPKATRLFCTIVKSYREHGVVYCSRFRLSVIKHDRLFSVPVSKLDQFGIFDEGDGITLAADKIEVLIANLGTELHGDPDWFKLRYT